MNRIAFEQGQPMNQRNDAALLRAGLQRIDSMPVNDAERALARAEFERAEAFAEKLAAVLEHLNRTTVESAVAFDERGEQLGWRD